MLATKYVILICVAVVRISATPKGAPEEACLNMSPGEKENAHGAKPQPQSSAPYKKTPSAYFQHLLKHYLLSY